MKQDATKESTTHFLLLCVCVISWTEYEYRNNVTFPCNINSGKTVNVSFVYNFVACDDVINTEIFLHLRV